MQTFLPFPSFLDSAKCLDYRRLGKQRVEAYQIYNALLDPEYGWQNHPATKMWRGYPDALALYHNEMIAEWKKRGYNNTMHYLTVEFPAEFPPWLGDEDFHLSHRSMLLQKDYEFYRDKFPADTPLNLGYKWPV